MAKQIMGNRANPNRSRTDFYPTHKRWTQAYLRHGDSIIGDIWEPACGNGDIVNVLHHHPTYAKRRIRATDILAGVNFLLQKETWKGSIITNPPFRSANRFILHALRVATEQVIMLLPIGALGGQYRRDYIWHKYPPELILIISDRMPVFGKISQFNHMWVKWSSNQQTQPTEIRWA